MSYLALRDMQDHGGFDECDLYVDHKGWIYRVVDGELIKHRRVGCDCKASSLHGEDEATTTATLTRCDGKELTP